MECVVFFEQKTAYEVRISYWSSDVCASDLVAEAAATTAALEIEIAVLAPLPEFLLTRVLRARSRFGRRNLRGGPHFGRQKSGRASGRARVCQYVEISVVAESLKKKTMSDVTHNLRANLRVQTKLQK